MESKEEIEAKIRLLQLQISKIETLSQYSIGIISGVIAGLFVIIIMNSYNQIFNFTGSILLAFIGGIVVCLILFYLALRPMNKAVKEAKILCKK
jgi:ABC-type Fe3+-siderophore transport system permease subunit